MRTLLAATLGWMSLLLAPAASAAERGYARVNGLRLYYEIHGARAKDGVPLVLLHRGGSTIDTSGPTRSSGKDSSTRRSTKCRSS